MWLRTYRSKFINLDKVDMLYARDLNVPNEPECHFIVVETRQGQSTVLDKMTEAESEYIIGWFEEKLQQNKDSILNFPWALSEYRLRKKGLIK
jgi:hypothetical protein